jgi:hypothetical protein
MNTYTITVYPSSEWLRATEKPWAYVVEADDMLSAMLAVLNVHRADQDDPHAYVGEPSFEGLPPQSFGYFNDLRSR